MNIHVHYGPGSIHDPEEERALKDARKLAALNAYIEALETSCTVSRARASDAALDHLQMEYEVILARAKMHNAAMLSMSYLQFGLLAVFVALAAGSAFVFRLLS